MWIKLDSELINMGIYSNMTIHKNQCTTGETNYKLMLYEIKSEYVVLASSYDYHSINVLYNYIIEELVSGSPVCDLQQLMKHKAFSGGDSGNVDQIR